MTTMRQAATLLAMSVTERQDALMKRLRAGCPESGVSWLEEVARTALSERSTKRLLDAFPATARRLGTGLLATTTTCEPEGTSNFTADVGGRAVLLLVAAVIDPENLKTVTEAAYDIGDTREKIAVVRSLGLLPDNTQLLPLALDAGRTNDANLFAALATDNPYACQRYPEPDLNKLVMKAAFVGIPIDRIIGLEQRCNQDLARMGMEYIDQQQSADRDFPPELWLAIGPHPPAGAVARMIGYLNHSVEAHRLGAARGLGMTADGRARAFLQERSAVEESPEVRAEVLRSLEALSATG